MLLLTVIAPAPSAAAPPASHSENYDSGLVERLLFRVAKKWVAGYGQDDAILAALDSNKRGMQAILNFLGEDTTDAEAVDQSVGEYLSLMGRVAATEEGVRVSGCVSAKPTQLGLSIGYDLCLQNFRRLARQAKELGQFLWMDIESARFTEDTISIYLEVLKEHRMSGVAVQSYLRRSASDLLHIIEEGGSVRLVKGAYHEPEEHAFSSKEEVDANYLKMMRMLFDAGGFFAVATHDSKLVEEAARLALEKGGSKNNNSSSGAKPGFEFQMLMGIRDELKSSLVSRGFRVSEYIPYGSNWLPYSVRRIRERKRNLLLLARSLI